MLDTGVGVVRMWADETSRLSRFRMLFTSFADRESLLPLAMNLFAVLQARQRRKFTNAGLNEAQEEANTLHGNKTATQSPNVLFALDLV